ncbi:MAG: hypothetical protein HY332_00165 [Chloroflexi bacterium]|nr:hypothetical protein [Chloroflexota bacterium]
MARTQRNTGVSDEAVRAKTGKTWPEWFEALDGAGAQQLDHRGIVAYLHQQHPELGGWWEQMVTVTYEQARGLREKHEMVDGYAVSVSKTVPVPASALFDAWHDDAARARWLDAPLTIRKATSPKSLRITWGDGRTNVDVHLYNKGADKAQVSVQHSKLADAGEAVRMKRYWAAALERLRAIATET